MFRKQNRKSGLVSRRAARYEEDAIIRQVPRQHDHLDVTSGGAIAQTSYYEYGPAPPNPPRGRIGLGADPAHPEGHGFR